MTRALTFAMTSRASRPLAINVLPVSTMSTMQSARPINGAISIAPEPGGTNDRVQFDSVLEAIKERGEIVTKMAPKEASPLIGIERPEDSKPTPARRMAETNE